MSLSIEEQRKKNDKAIRELKAKNRKLRERENAEMGKLIKREFKEFNIKTIDDLALFINAVKLSPNVIKEIQNDMERIERKEVNKNVDNSHQHFSSENTQHNQ